jgi:NAD(P)-dependent dehydrogenase (short-subunit alcohol dehydrogenase family)
VSHIAIITGGSRGIGAATARLAAEAGYDVCINYASDAEAARQVVVECETNGGRAIAVQADVADSADVARLFRECDEKLGPVSLLVNNAGIIGQATTVVDLTDDTLARTFAVNVHGSIFCAREAIKRMARSAGGSGGVIVNVSSVAARLGSPGEYVHYAASKAAIETFTIGLAKEVGPDGIRVNALQAGTTDTEIHAAAGNPGRPAMVAANAPLRRVATPEDIAAGIMWLASAPADYVSGAILPVSGGL